MPFKLKKGAYRRSASDNDLEIIDIKEYGNK